MSLLDFICRRVGVGELNHWRVDWIPNAFNDYKLAIDGGKVCDFNCIVNKLLSIQILSQCVLKILIHIDIFLFQLVGMITRYNLTHEYMEHCLENLGWN